eukprot:GGOE01041971.1.p4 GENE.GGOE01041971.1~~GGOE01041971.1.p4  ORF type:complete len:149 (+),score=40.53 GGOE01041971.1:540-986(+)
MGGCPFAADALVGNVATEALLAFGDREGIQTDIDREELLHAEALRLRSFSNVLRELLVATALEDEVGLRRIGRAHFDAARRAKSGGWSCEEFQGALQRAYLELGETPPNVEELAAKFHRHARGGQLGFEEFLRGMRRGLQKRLRRPPS